MSGQQTRVPALETPSGKSAETENFPVGSQLIAKHLRPHVARFYAFARAIDDIADNPDLDAADKIARLDAFGAAVRGEEKGAGLETAQRMHDSLVASHVPVQHCLDLISAFKQDAVKSRYEHWEELIDYCDRSAAPVGRYLLDLHGEDRAHWDISNALCNSLQVINHMQDCADDYRQMDRIYLPQNWMREVGAVDEDLGKAHATPALRRVLDRCVSGCETLNETARDLPVVLKSKRLALESGVIVQIARRLTHELSHRDPLAQRVKLRKPRLMMTGARGIFKALLGIR
ncbi:squalene synthase HpnC [Iodidimonas muriae]|uniref:Squalene synthase HpnC n=1 Tax=Iodidimonas muriae TaxID=261467 RepID=A0ABQ2LCE8_9PROT|nr:squalene synthase HpnC [Iodidimonas muriae]GER07437.1 squalene synthase HpnC [Kordiimonadales bacterium JCM 17843]GGO10516.1 squalene synthase HpnC [Iodidimonas muriae]